MDRCASRFTVSLIPQATLSDLASFAPAAVSLGGEPAGHGVVGLPTNFLVAASEHTATGTLFDRPVTVRFSPIGVTIAPGDGSQLRTRDTAQSWSSLGLAQFSPTASTHTYTQRGVYTATATIQYSAAVNYGNGWIDVAGVLDIPTSSYSVTVLEARSALVDRTCHEDPSGPGC